MKTVLEKNIEFEGRLLEACRSQFPEINAQAAVNRVLNRLEHEGQRQQKLLETFKPELQRLFGGK